MSKSDSEQIEEQLIVLKGQLSKGEALERLLKNHDFRTLIDEGYFRDEAARLTGILSDRELNESREFIIEDLKAISSFRMFLENIRKDHARNVHLITAGEQELELARVEEAEAADFEDENGTSDDNE